MVLDFQLSSSSRREQQRLFLPVAARRTTLGRLALPCTELPLHIPCTHPVNKMMVVLAINAWPCCAALWQACCSRTCAAPLRGACRQLLQTLVLGLRSPGSELPASMVERVGALHHLVTVGSNSVGFTSSDWSYSRQAGFMQQDVMSSISAAQPTSSRVWTDPSSSPEPSCIPEHAGCEYISLLYQGPAS